MGRGEERTQRAIHIKNMTSLTEKTRVKAQSEEANI